MNTITHPTDTAALVAMFPDLAVVLPSGPVLVWRTAVLPGTAESAGAARRLAAGALAVAGSCPAAGDAAVVADELVANAVEHTRSGRGGEVRVTVAAAPGEWVLVLVGDDGPSDGAVPVIPAQRPPADSESGRGLLLVATMSAANGYAPGCVSWALLPWEGTAR
jgi:anti-sigma regulatory factor (Ser/Thr protein kinase)